MRIAASIVAIAALAIQGRAEIGNIVVTDAASFQKGWPSPGSIASVFCTGLTGISGIVTAEHYPLPLELLGVRVRIGGVPAPLFAVAQFDGYEQINIQVPLEASLVSFGDIDVTVEQGGQQTTARVPRGSDGEFFRMSDGAGAFQHATDYVLVSASNPARAGEVVVGYLTGVRASTTPVV